MRSTILLLAPLLPIGLMRLSLAERVRREGLSGAALVSRLMRQAMALHLIGFVFILLTGVWGTFQNLLARPF